MSVKKKTGKKVFGNFGDLSSAQGSLSNNGLWKVKKKICPKYGATVPIAKKDMNGLLVTNPDLLKKLYLDTYQQGLRHRPIRADLVHIKSLKEDLFYQRLKLAKMCKSEPWLNKDLDKVQVKTHC